MIQCNLFVSKVINLLGGYKMRVEETIYNLLNKNGIDWNEELYNAQLTDLGIDSMLFIQLVVDIEDEFGFEFDDEDLLLELYDTMEDVINKVKKYI